MVEDPFKDLDYLEQISHAHTLQTQFLTPFDQCSVV
jgi:hypothetical protein